MEHLTKPPPPCSMIILPPGRGVQHFVRDIARLVKLGPGNIQTHPSNLRGKLQTQVVLHHFFFFFVVRCWLKPSSAVLVLRPHAISGPVSCTISDMCGGGVGAGVPALAEVGAGIPALVKEDVMPRQKQRTRRQKLNKKDLRMRRLNMNRNFSPCFH
jgi:hypothetical protein